MLEIQGTLMSSNNFVFIWEIWGTLQRPLSCSTHFFYFRFTSAIHLYFPNNFISTLRKSNYGDPCVYLCNSFIFVQRFSISTLAYPSAFLINKPCAFLFLYDGMLLLQGIMVTLDRIGYMEGIS
jgi:hypothetical protein